MNYIFRNATEDDTEQLRQLGLNSYGQFESILTEENWTRLKTNLLAENLYSDLLKKGVCFVCVTAEAVIGMAFLIPNGNPTEIFPAEYCYLRMVGVHTGFSGKGIGRKLTQLCIDHAKASGEQRMALHTAEFMDSARHIYESVGFIKTRELKQMLGKKYWFYTLEL